jgi:hypothetical protein
MNNDTNWEFMLNGDIQEFRQLAGQRTTAYFQICGGVDHWLDCPNDDFRMKTLYCNEETDPETAWQVGHELLSIFNGASVLIKRDYRKASIFRLLHNDREISYTPQRGTTALLGKPDAPQTRLDEEFSFAKNASIKLHLLHLATENKDLYFILKYFDMALGWATYYKLVEAIGEFADQKNISLKTCKSQKKSFTNTANNFSLSGFDSRHGFKKAIKQNKTPIMNLNEGHDFVSDLARQYINLAYFRPSVPVI